MSRELLVSDLQGFIMPRASSCLDQRLSMVGFLGSLPGGRASQTYSLLFSNAARTAMAGDVEADAGFCDVSGVEEWVVVERQCRLASSLLCCAVQSRGGALATFDVGRVLAGGLRQTPESLT